MTYQEWCIEAIKTILKMKNQNEGQYGYKMILKDIVRHYPEVFMDDGEQMHFWTRQVSKKCMRSFKRSFVGSLIMTKKAHNVVKKGIVKGVRDDLYQEHIMPVQYVFMKLKELRKRNRINDKAIGRCMTQNKLVLLHQSEKKHLDGRRFTKKDYNCLTKMLSEVHHKSVDAQVELKEAKALIGKSSTDHGSGLFRICKLLVKGVKFVDATGEECSSQRLVEFLVRDFTEYEYTM